MGLKGPELLRLMSQGVIEFGTATLSYFASDNPINEAIDLAGLAPDAQTARAVTNAFEPVYARLYGEATTSCWAFPPIRPRCCSATPKSRAWPT